MSPPRTAIPIDAAAPTAPPESTSHVADGNVYNARNCDVISLFNTFKQLSIYLEWNLNSSSGLMRIWLLLTQLRLL